MDSIVKQRIREAHKFSNDHAKRLEVLLHELNNSMNECDCNHRKIFDFCTRDLISSSSVSIIL